MIAVEIASGDGQRLDLSSIVCCGGKVLSCAIPGRARYDQAHEE